MGLSRGLGISDEQDAVDVTLDGGDRLTNVEVARMYDGAEAKAVDDSDEPPRLVLGVSVF